MLLGKRKPRSRLSSGARWGVLRIEKKEGPRIYFMRSTFPSFRLTGLLDYCDTAAVAVCRTASAAATSAG